MVEHIGRALLKVRTLCTHRELCGGMYSARSVLILYLE